MQDRLYHPGSAYKTYVYDTENGRSYSSIEHPKKKPVQVIEYRPQAPNPVYGIVRTACPFCRVYYAAWVVGNDGWQTDSKEDSTEPSWNVFDLSYWHSFNDEPYETDIADRVEVDAKLVAELIQQHIGSQLT